MQNSFTCFDAFEVFLKVINHHLMKVEIAVLLILFLTDCSSRGNHKKNVNQIGKSNHVQRIRHHKKSAADTSFVHKIIFNREESYGSTKKIIVGKIEAFAVDDSSRVYIADADKTTIEVFDPNGHYLKSLGREGQGPGEFSAITFNTTMTVHANKLYVTDYASGSDFFPIRVQIFSLKDLSFAHTMKILAGNKNDYPKLRGYFPMGVYPRNDGTFLVGYRKIPNEYRDSTSFICYVIQNSAGNIVNGPIFQRKDRINLVYLNKTAKIPILVIYPFPFYGKSLLAVSNQSRLYAVNNTQRFKVSVYTPNGKYLRSFQHTFHNVPLSRSGLIKRYRHKMSQLGKGVAVKMIRHAHNLPKTWPALHSMKMDDHNRLWVSTIVKNQKVFQWWVLNKKGKLLAKFNWPRSKPIKKIKNGYLYTMETNQKTGVRRIVRYKIQMQ
jgi:hypothetical protein